jgi:transposase
MTRDEAKAILALPQDKAIQLILALVEKAEKYDQIVGGVSPTTPSGMTPVYLKPTRGKRRKPAGRKKGHPGISRFRPEQVDHFKENTIDCCPDCQNPVKDPIKTYTRYVEDIPRIEKPEVTEHTLYGYWCSNCKKVVFPTLTDALPNAMIGLRLVVFTAWLHYLVGVSVNNIVKILSVVCRFKISAGGLTQAWINLANLLQPAYNHIGEKISQSGVLSADETGWRLNGITHWLWCFTTKTLCYYLITKSRGSPVIREVLGSVFRGILICDFWGAYNKITALAKQRCFYHLFTELSKVVKVNRSSSWKAFRKKLLRLLKDALRLSQKRTQLEPEKYNSLKSRMYARLEQILST